MIRTITIITFELTIVQEEILSIKLSFLDLENFSLNLFFICLKLKIHLTQKMEPSSLPENFDKLPDEMVLQMMIRIQDPETLNSWCHTSTRATRLCKDDFFWKMKYQYKYKDKSRPPEGRTWKERYRRISQSFSFSPIVASKSRYAIIDKMGILYMAGQSVYQGSMKEGTYIDSKIPIRMPFKSKVLSVALDSFSRGKIIAATEDGVYRWGTTRPIMIMPVGYRSPLPLKKIVQFDKYKPVKLAISISEHGILMMMNDGSLILGVEEIYYGATTGSWISTKIPFNAIDIHSNDRGFYIISSDHKLFKLHVDVKTKRENKENPNFPHSEYSVKINIHHVTLPEPIKQYSGDAGSRMFLSMTGNLYTWGDTSYRPDGNTKRVGEPISRLLPTKIILPKPISFFNNISEGITAITIDGELYVWGKNNYGRLIDIRDQSSAKYKEYMTELSAPSDYETIMIGVRSQIRVGQYPIPARLQINIGSPVDYVAIGENFTIAVTDDGWVNYWGDPEFPLSRTN